MSRKRSAAGSISIADLPLVLDPTMATYALRFVFPAAFALLPGVMNTPAAKATTITIALQESRFIYRRQLGNGPARGFWQFERGGGVKGVLTHPGTKSLIAHACSELCYTPTVDVCYTAIEHNDVLACCFARLLLWTTPGLPAERHQPDKAWSQYIDGWRPGKPHRATWNELYEKAWMLVQA